MDIMEWTCDPHVPYSQSNGHHGFSVLFKMLICTHVHVYTCTGTHVWGHAHVSTRPWRPEDNSTCHTQELSSPPGLELTNKARLGWPWMMVPSSLPYWLNSQEGLSWLIIWVLHSVCRMFVCVLTETSHRLLFKPYDLVILKLIRCEPVTSAGDGQIWPLVFFHSIKI